MRWRQWCGHVMHGFMICSIAGLEAKANAIVLDWKAPLPTAIKDSTVDLIIGSDIT